MKKLVLFLVAISFLSPYSYAVEKYNYTTFDEVIFVAGGGVDEDKLDITDNKNNENADQITTKLPTDFDFKKSISQTMLESLISMAIRRSTFIDSVMDSSMQNFLNTSIRDFNQTNKEHSLFILPYASSQNVELSLNEESKGHTKGTIIGYSTLKDSGIYGVYAGYEDTKMSSTYFNINNRTYYAGLKYFNTLFTTKKGQEVYIKAQGKTALIKNDLTKRVGTNEAKAEPNSYAYGMSSDIGMNFIYDKDIFSPEIGLAYEGGY
ncbi:autotransporter outer membrane beta-barrel domain-containing protein, partial [Campylobacter novaezeelandiae]